MKQFDDIPIIPTAPLKVKSLCPKDESLWVTPRWLNENVNGEFATVQVDLVCPTNELKGCIKTISDNDILLKALEIGKYSDYLCSRPRNPIYDIKYNGIGNKSDISFTKDKESLQSIKMVRSFVQKYGYPCGKFSEDKKLFIFDIFAFLNLCGLCYYCFKKETLNTKEFVNVFNSNIKATGSGSNSITFKLKINEKTKNIEMYREAKDLKSVIMYQLMLFLTSVESGKKPQICARCQHPFKASNMHEKYCPDCKSDPGFEKERRNIRQRKWREKKKAAQSGNDNGGVENGNDSEARK